MRVRVVSLLAVGALCGLGCGGSHERGEGRDAGHLDAGPGTMDGGIVDAAPGTDAPSVDAGWDAGPLECESPELPAGVGCDFWLADLDNAAVHADRDASGEPVLAMVTNAGPVDATVAVRTVAPDGTEDSTSTLTVPAGSSETLLLDRREVDGSTADGLNDGTHTAVTRNAFRFESSSPVSISLLNPGTSAEQFSVDGTLVFGAQSLGTRYTVAAWPQTIAHDDTNPDHDFDATRDDEDLRAFLTIIGTEMATDVRVELGARVVEVEGGSGIDPAAPGAVIERTLQPFEVLNLETGAFMADFTGTVVTASAPVAVFVGAEAADVPLFETYATRQCCADHLSGQLLPDEALGSRYVIARTPPPQPAINEALEDPSHEVTESTPIEWVRVVAVEDGSTTVRTTLAAPDDAFVLTRGEAMDLRADRDFTIQADGKLSLLQLLPSGQARGIPSELPAGDPSLLVVPPIDSFRSMYSLSTPPTFPFDFLTVVAPTGATVEIDGAPAADGCASSRVGGWNVLRCQLSFPRIVETSGVRFDIEDGSQDDGYHTVRADMPISVLVSGFGEYSSYAYAAGWGTPPPAAP